MLRRQCGNQLRADGARGTSKLIAIIDDDDAMQDSLRDLMEAAGLVARCFGSAEEFLESGLHRQAACLITDILMPKMSGLELQTRLNDEECDIPIIFITAYGDARMRIQAMREGAVEFLAKPFESSPVAQNDRDQLGRSASSIGSQLVTTLSPKHRSNRRSAWSPVGYLTVA